MTPGWARGVHACWLTAIVLVLAMECASARPSPRTLSPVRHYQLKLGSIVVNVISVNLRSPRISIVPVVAPHKKASFNQFIKHFRPAAAINGTFFDTRTWRITGNIVHQGKLLHEGYVGNAIAFTHDNRPTLVRNTGVMGRHTDWKPYRSAIGGGPTLLVGGRLQLDPRSEGFRDPGLFRHARRSAVGYTRSGTLLMVGVRTPVTFHELARIMSELGVSDALSLDGGSSSALYYKGRVVSSPHRSLTNLLAVYERKVRTPVARSGNKTARSVARSGNKTARSLAGSRKKPARSLKRSQAQSGVGAPVAGPDVPPPPSVRAHGPLAALEVTCAIRDESANRRRTGRVRRRGRRRAAQDTVGAPAKHDA